MYNSHLFLFLRYIKFAAHTLNCQSLSLNSEPCVRNFHYVTKALRDKGTNHGESGARTYRGSRRLYTSGVQGLRPPEADEISQIEWQILHWNLYQIRLDTNNLTHCKIALHTFIMGTPYPHCRSTLWQPHFSIYMFAQTKLLKDTLHNNWMVNWELRLCLQKLPVGTRICALYRPWRTDNQDKRKRYKCTPVRGLRAHFNNWSLLFWQFVHMLDNLYQHIILVHGLRQTDSQSSDTHIIRVRGLRQTDSHCSDTHIIRVYEYTD